MFNTQYPWPPYTLDSSGDPGEIDLTTASDITLPAGAPAVADDNVWPCQRTGRDGVLENGKTWQLKGRFSGTAADAGDVLVTLHAYDRVTAQWYAVAALRFVGADLLGTVDLGNAKDFTSPLGTSHLAAVVVGLAADQTLHLVHREAQP